MNPHRDETHLDWQPGWDWLLPVVGLHILFTVPWVAALGWWALVPGALSMLYHLGIYRRGETWRFAFVEDAVVLFEPERPERKGEARRPAKLRGGPWITANWVVVRTSRRVLAMHGSRYDAVRFARLRRALLGGLEAGNG